LADFTLNAVLLPLAVLSDTAQRFEADDEQAVGPHLLQTSSALSSHSSWVKGTQPVCFAPEPTMQIATEAAM